MGGLLHWLAIHTGTLNEPGPYYGFLSGAGSDLTELAAAVAVAWAILRRHNCHQHRCVRLGRFPVADGKFHTCRKHHPDPAVREGLRAHHILAAHRAHAEALAGPEPVPAPAATDGQDRKLDRLHDDLTDLTHTLRAVLLGQQQRGSRSR